ncbi:hypothetical protein B9G39_06425 [Zooshikella ganghwensis]|uniref:Uncharacterized protein n=1 Tax=Zooshikella ganghwensis TaxID=202772 RepID=A0A4P9VL37_9GAMM|nr:hypothetical protein B9G39_06425 [Zooshikella ganghwensis]
MDKFVDHPYKRGLNPLNIDLFFKLHSKCTLYFGDLLVAGLRECHLPTRDRTTLKAVTAQERTSSDCQQIK